MHASSKNCRFSICWPEACFCKSDPTAIAYEGIFWSQAGPLRDVRKLRGVGACIQVSTGVTLRENNLKEIEGGRIMDSQGVLVANKQALREQPGLLAVVHELIERLEVPVPLCAVLHACHLRLRNSGATSSNTVL